MFRKDAVDFDYGPLKTLFADNSITEIMVNSWDQIFIEKEERLVPSGVRFQNEKVFLDLLARMIQDLHPPRKETRLHYDGMLPEGLRYNITLPPMSPKSPSLTLRKFALKSYTLSDLVDIGALSDKAAYFLECSVKARATIVVSGGTGTGKTTVLNSLSASIPADQRVVTIEDVQELQLQVKNWVSLVTCDKDPKVTSRDCLINCLRMRPDRIIIGECRRDETFEMLQAMNSGHEGSMTTVHANNAQEALTRIEALLFSSQFDLPIKVMRYQISEAIDLIVQLKRNSKGERRICEIVELTGMESDVVTRAIVFSENENQELVPTGYVPRTLEKIRNAKIPFAPDFFNTPVNSPKVAKN